MPPPIQSGLTSLTDFLPGAARVGSQYSDPYSQMYTTQDPLDAMFKARMRQSLGPNAQAFFPELFTEELKYPALTADEEQDLWSSLGKGGMSALGHVGNTLDKYTGSRALRALVAGISGKVPWKRAGRELLSTIPGSDLFGLTDKKDTIWAEDITGLKGPGYTGYRKGFDFGDVVNFGLDVALDPTLPLTFGTKGAAVRGMRALQKAGHADSFFDAIKAGHFGKTPGMGMREAKIKYTLDDVFKWADEVNELDPARGTAIKSDLFRALESENLLSPAAGMDLVGYSREGALARHASGKPIMTPSQRVLDEPLSGLVGFGVPFRKPVTTMGHGPIAQSAARAMDVVGDSIRHAPVIRNMLALFDHRLKGALSREGKRVATRISSEAADRNAAQQASLAFLHDEIWRTDIGRAQQYRILPGGLQVGAKGHVPRGVTFGDMFDDAAIGRAAANENYLALRRYLEGVDDELPEWARGFGLEEKINDVRDLVHNIADYYRSYGGTLPNLDDLIDFFPRTRESVGILDKGRQGQRMFDTRTQHAIPREEILKYHPGGTAALMRLSMDPVVSGALHRMARGVRGTARRLPESEMARLRTHVVENYWDDLYGGDYAKHYNPPPGVAPGVTPELDYRTLTKAQLSHIVDPIINWAARLDPRHAAEGIPVFRRNPFEDIARYLQSVGDGAEASRGVHELFAEVAGYHGTLEAGIDAIPVEDALRAVGLEDPIAVNRFYETALTNRLSYEKMLAKGDVDKVKRFAHDPLPGGDQPLMHHAKKDFEGLLVPRKFVDEAKRYLRPFSNPTELNAFVRAYDIFTNAFKTGVTTLFPAFHTRNFISGMFNNYISGAFDPRYSGPRAIWQPMFDAWAMAHGKTVPGMAEIAFLDPNTGRVIEGLTDETATRRAAAHLYGHNVHRAGGGAQDPSEVLRASGGQGAPVGLAGTYQPTPMSVMPTPFGFGARAPKAPKRIMDDYGNWMPQNIGQTESTGRGFLRSMGARIVGPTASMGPTWPAGLATVAMPEHFLPRVKKVPSSGVPGIRGRFGRLLDKFGDFLPWNIRGVAGDETRFAFARWGEQTASMVEYTNRAAPFIAYLRQGYSPAEAARKVKAAQVDYSAMTDFERKVMKRVFPFYSFTRRMTPYVVEQLVQRPSGAMAQVIRRSQQLRDHGPESDLLPPWVTRGTAIPLPGGGVEGHKKYLMSLGLAHEDPLSMVHVGETPWQTISSTTRNVLSRANPLIRTPIEAATGKTMYGGGDLRFTKPAWAYGDQKGMFGEVPMVSGFFGEAPQEAMPPTGPLHTLSANLYPFMPSFPSYLAHAGTGGLIPRGSSRYFTTERIIGDERKSGWERLMDVTTGFKTGDVDINRTRNMMFSRRIKDLLLEAPGVVGTEHIYAPSLEKLSPRNQLMMRAYMQHTREQQRIRRAQRMLEEGGENLYPRFRKSPLTPESMFR